MGKIIDVRFRRSRLPRRLLNDGWWLETPPARSPVTALAKRHAARPKSRPELNSKPRVRHLTLVTSGQ